MSKPDQFRFRKSDEIGSADADDDEFLKACFVDTGELEELLDCNKPHRVVVGRTGIGKTAILNQIHNSTNNVIRINPESLAIAYISSSNILQWIQELGVQLQPFFKLLWRHVFTVEILKKHYHINSEEEHKSFRFKIGNILKNKRDRQALDYIEKWSNSFWEETEYRVKEITEKLETEILDGLGANVALFSASLGGGLKLSEEQKKEIINKAQNVVSRVQIRQLTDIFNMLDEEILTDSQKKYYIVIDRLDEEWIEDKFRYKLIRALIDTVKEFRKIKYAKIIIALRLDLLDRVFALTRDSGFQEEKYESMYVRIQWTKDQLIEVIDRRVEHLIASKYTNAKVTHKHILPKANKGLPWIDYIIERSFYRPRDVIQFINICIREAADKPMITVQNIKSAEAEYSDARLNSVYDEWRADYPKLKDTVELLRNRRKRFKIGEISADEITEFCVELLSSSQCGDGEIEELSQKYCDAAISEYEFAGGLFFVFFKTGLVLLKVSPTEPFSGVNFGRPKRIIELISKDTSVQIHPMFWRALGTKE